MSKIYIDVPLSLYFTPNTFNVYDNYRSIPDDCDVIVMTTFSNSYTTHSEVIDYLLPKTKKLLLVLVEPTPGPQGTFDQFIIQHNNPKLYVFSIAVLNFNFNNFETVMPWFDYFENFYAEYNWAKDLILQLKFNFNKTKKFDCLLGMTKSHRNAIENLYLQSNCKNDIIFSYFKNNLRSGIWSHNISSANATVDHVNHQGNNVRLSALLPVDIYNDSYYSIIAETTCSNAYSHYTEKTAKALIARRPFIPFCGQYFLKNLKSVGFRTFSSVIDESYDNIEDLQDRFNTAWQQVEWLCKQDPEQVLTELASVLDYNQRHFLTTDWWAPIKKYI